MDANGCASTIGLVACNTVNVDNPLLAVDLGDLSLTTLVFPSDNADLVIFADGERTSLKWSI